MLTSRYIANVRAAAARRRSTSSAWCSSGPASPASASARRWPASMCCPGRRGPGAHGHGGACRCALSPPCAAGAGPGARLLACCALPRSARASIGGFLFRIGVGATALPAAAAVPARLRLHPFQSGLAHILDRSRCDGDEDAAVDDPQALRLPRVLIANALLSSALHRRLRGCSSRDAVLADRPALLVGGFFRSLQFTSINAIAYADVDAPRMSRATALAAVGQQLSLSAGVAVGGAGSSSRCGSRECRPSPPPTFPRRS